MLDANDARMCCGNSRPVLSFQDAFQLLHAGLLQFMQNCAVATADLS